MPYPKKLLNDYETVALDLHPHWWYFARPAFALLASIVLGIVSLAMLDGDLADVVRWIALIAIVLSAIWLVIRYLKWATTNFVVTNDRVIFRNGVVAKSGIEIPLDRVNNVIFNQSFFERIIGAGDLVIESGGETGQQQFTDVRSPDRVQKLIHAQKSEKDRRRHSGDGGSDVATQLEKLEGLLERGTITRDEFEDEKRRLLDG
ncbi:MAG: PH domain-containing protein [Ilumatobacter sp.]|uniref:PH domain-containing protein n=1 Tax=Ilumatobacter sp. TaxID=1967498 RepID=UPI002636F144|nr:PH domain-containing protein [Ilumatobacter sp.]MDJ0768895.1 PH domain-containing protein [Ilumatobacter sp.]